MNNSLLRMADEDARPLRDWQARAIDDLRESLRSGNRRPVLQAPTGLGKSRLAGEIVKLALEKGKRAVFTCPALSLVDQTVESFYRDGIHDIGVMQSNHPLTDPTKFVQVATVQTLERRPHPETDIVIVDEAHRRSKFMETWMAKPEWAKVPFIGLSATPWTKGLGKHFDSLIVAMTTKEAIEQGLLSPYIAFGIDSPSTAGIKTVGGDYHEKQASERMQEKKLVANIVTTWLARGRGLPTLCFCVDLAHAKAVQQDFLAAGIPCAYQDAFTEDFERREIKRKFHSGEYPVVCSVGTLILGVDWDVRCIIWARMTKSEILFCQGIGRGLRLANGKEHLIVLDHAGTFSGSANSLGHVTEIHHDSLDDGVISKAEKKPPLPKACPKCKCLRPIGRSECPACGFKAEAPRSKIQTIAGELVELRPGQIPKRVKGNSVLLGTRLIPKRDLYGELLCYAQQHGRKQGWAAHSFRELTGVWPDAYANAPMIPPSMEVLSWAKSKNIRWAKANAR